MKSTGVVRKLDELGRIVLPKELRNNMGLTEGTPLEIYVEGEIILLKKYEPFCVFCGEGHTKVVMGKNICPDCLEKLKG